MSEIAERGYVHPEVLVSTDWVAAHKADANIRVVETNEDQLLYPSGHIPGAVNRAFRDNLQADGRFKPAEQLRAEFGAVLGGRPAADVVHQCGSGVTACHNLLAMEFAGMRGAALYPGSWSEWIADPARPVATGA